MPETIPSPLSRIASAMYVRMSTEHQQYSTENQSDAMLRYAQAHGMEIVRTYADEGKSGLSLSGRPALRALLQDVENGRADYNVILVYDISRWGRFQDVDESAYYEYICKRANVRVHYCAEQFENDGSLSSTLMKTIKRTMAGEYSRELSVKVFAGQCRLIELGFRQGGTAGYGLRRQLIDRDGAPKELLARGIHKSIQTDRVILVPGPEEEVDVVRRIFQFFTHEKKTEREIATWLNSRGLRTDWDRFWTRAAVHSILTNPKYAGCNVYNRRSYKLKRKRVKNPPEMWIRREGAFVPVVSTQQFNEALAIIHQRNLHLSDEQLLQRLRDLLQRCGTLSGVLIDEAEEMPSSSAYRHRFGSLVRAYRLIGFTPQRDLSFIEANRLLRQCHIRQMDRIIQALAQCGAHVDRNPQTDILTVNQEFTVSLALARCRSSSAGNHRWLVRLDNSLGPDVTIAARLCPGNVEILDYYLLPGMDALAEKLRLAKDNGLLLDVYRFENLNFFMHMAKRVAVGEAA